LLASLDFLEGGSSILLNIIFEFENFKNRMSMIVSIF
jgi:hypothetical protein